VWLRVTSYFILFIFLRTITHLVRYGFFETRFPVVPFSQVTFNTGFFFGFIPVNGLIFSVVLIVIWLVLCVFFVRFIRHNRLLLASYIGLILVGGLSNIIDRVWYGGVVDYIAIGNFPIFNLSDVCIVLGAGGILLHIFHTPLIDR
jgi:lipoprotein signal peptidase